MAETKKTTPKKAVKESVKKGAKKSILEAETIQTEEIRELNSAPAKAGKRSIKASKEAEAKKAKEIRKTATTEAEKAKPGKKPSRPRIQRMSKKYREVAKLIDKSKTYSLNEALELAVKTSTTKFDSSVEMHINLGVDPKQADQNIRGTVSLPAGTGKVLRVAVFADGDDAQAGKQAGADIVGSTDIAQQLDKEEINFDVLIATPSLMAKLGKYAKLLGPRGLMPSPKSGTVAADVAKAVQESKAGKVEYRVDSTGIIHINVGKVSFGPEKLLQNANTILNSIQSSKPASLKGTYMKSAFVSTTMGPGIKVEILG